MPVRVVIFDSWNEKLYPDGQAAAIYGQTPPRVNVCRPPGEWQTFDIVFTAPVFEGGTLRQPARVTMFHNGVLVHLHEEIHGETGHRIVPEYKSRVSRGPLVLGGHNCPVRFRNIWCARCERGRSAAARAGRRARGRRSAGFAEKVCNLRRVSPLYPIEDRAVWRPCHRRRPDGEPDSERVTYGCGTSAELE